jgi:NAD(P)-dependent dehydrogenase (short-subunit alcohol dehydrogenase family)
MNALFSLQDRCVLVTGAAGGLGFATAELCAQQGAAVVLSDVDAAALEQALQSLLAQGLRACAWTADAAHAEAQEALLDQAWAWQGCVHTVVCNAGIQGPAGPLHAASADDWQRVMDINLRGAAVLASGAAQRMAAAGGGSIVLMSSIAGLRGNKAIGLYGLSKAALAQLARNLAVEWGPQNVRANAISPGLIRTPFSAGLMADTAFMQRRLAATPLRRVGEPQEIAAVAVLLASTGGAFITGQNLVVDGGTLVSDGS